MLDKLIVLYSFIIILNLAFKLCTAVDLSKNATSVQNTRVKSVTDAEEDTWQPIIQTYKWLAKPTTLTPSLSVSTTPTLASDYSKNLRNNLANHSKQKQQGYIKSQPYYNPAYNHHQQQHQYHHNGNYSRRHIKPSSASSLLSSLTSSSAPSQSIKDIKLRSHVYSTTNNKKNIKNSGGKTQPNYHHHQQQLYHLNNIESVHTQIQIPKDFVSQIQEQNQKPLSNLMKNEKNSISSELNLSHIEDVTTAKHYTKQYSSTPVYWHYLQQPQTEAKHIISLTPKIYISNANIMNKTMNSNVKINAFSNGNETEKNNVKNSNSLTKTLNSFITNENLIDNENTNQKKHQQHMHNHYQHYASLLHSGGVKSVTSPSSKDVDKNSIKSTTSHAATDDEKNFNGKLLLLRNILNNVQEFYDNFKKIILSDNDDDTDDYDIYSNEDKTSDDDNDLQILNSSPNQARKDTSTTTMLMPSASMGEVQGRQRQITNGKIKYSSLQDTNQVQNSAVAKATLATSETQATSRLVNLLSTKSSSLLPSTSKALAAVSSGRKVKKVKKKFQKFLLPLVLAYKLKFMALIPLLIGGLTLLVGTTGLAGFFFALFTAVMSLKSGSRSAIVVKKY